MRHLLTHLARRLVLLLALPVQVALDLVARGGVELGHFPFDEAAGSPFGEDHGHVGSEVAGEARVNVMGAGWWESEGREGKRREEGDGGAEGGGDVLVEVERLG